MRPAAGSDEQPIQKRQRRQADQPFEPIHIYVQSGMSGCDLGEFLVNACDPAEQLLAKLVSKHPTLPYGILCIGTNTLHAAASYGFTEMAVHLVQTHGAKVESLDNKGFFYSNNQKHNIT